MLNTFTLIISDHATFKKMESIRLKRPMKALFRGSTLILGGRLSKGTVCSSDFVVTLYIDLRPQTTIYFGFI